MTGKRTKKRRIRIPKRAKPWIDLKLTNCIRNDSSPGWYLLICEPRTSALDKELFKHFCEKTKMSLGSGLKRYDLQYKSMAIHIEMKPVRLGNFYHVDWNEETIALYIYDFTSSIVDYVMIDLDQVTINYIAHEFLRWMGLDDK